LKDYRDNRGEPVDLVPSGLPASEALPFSLRVADDPNLTSRLNNALYRVSDGGRVDATQSPASVTFEFEDAAGLRVRKDFRFDPANYVVALSVDAKDGDRTINPSIVWGPGPGDVTPALANPGFFNRGGSLPPPELILHRNGKVERIAINKISEQPIQEGQFRFAGVDDHYFMIAAVNPGQTRLESRALVVPGPADQRRQFISHAVRFPQPPMNVRFFVGPKQFDLLRSIDGELVRAVNYGMFGWLAVPLLGALKWLHGIVGNWGWSIVLLTVLINLAMFPLRHKSVVSMRRMQELQPQLKAIQDRYANLKLADPGTSEDEYRGDEPLSRERRQPGQRLHSDAAHDAGAVCVLPTARTINRVAGCRIRLVDQGSLATGSVFHHSDSGFADNVLAAEDDACSGSGSHAAPDDDAHADRVRLYLSDDGGRNGAVLVCQ
jgi:YidC/Oxa1 family membrane protein insertase